MTDSERYKQGRDKLHEIHGDRGTNAIDGMQEVAPELSKFVYEFAFGDIYCRKELDLKSRQLITVSALAAMATAPAQLRAHIHGALNVGWKREEIIEALTQIAVYAGFPAALNAVKIAREVFADRDNDNKTDA